MMRCLHFLHCAADSLPLSQLDTGDFRSSGPGCRQRKRSSVVPLDLESRHTLGPAVTYVVWRQHPRILWMRKLLPVPAPPCDEHILARLDALHHPPLLLGHHRSGLSSESNGLLASILVCLVGC